MRVTVGKGSVHWLPFLLPEGARGHGCRPVGSAAAGLPTHLLGVGQSVAALEREALEQCLACTFCQHTQLSLPGGMICFYVFIEGNYFLAPCWACWVIS